MLRPGYTEKQVANTLVSKYREYGDGEAYSPIVATGPNGALPHAIPTDREFTYHWYQYLKKLMELLYTKSRSCRLLMTLLDSHYLKRIL